MAGDCCRRALFVSIREVAAINRILQNLISEAPLRLLIKAALTNPVARRYAFEWAALFDALRYPAYALGLQTACKYARLASAAGFTAIEFGVAGGNGLMELSKYAAEMSQRTGLKIKVVGFDSGAGLPQGTDYRDAPWLWNPGDFPCNVNKLRLVLPTEIELVVGQIQKMLPHWFEERPRLPVGFVSVDVDYYSSTASILETLGNVDVRCLLPFVSFYFDDVLRYLTPRCTGESAALDEFNRSHDRRQFDRDDWLSEDRPFGNRLWLRRMYSLCCLDHPALEGLQTRETARLDLVEK